MSSETFYPNLRRGEMTRPGVEAEEEKALIEAGVGAQMAALPLAVEVEV